MKIRKYMDGDFEGLSHLLKANYDSDITEETLKTHYLNEKRFILIAEDDNGDIVGDAFVHCDIDYVRPKKSFFVTYLGVDPEKRHLGTGKALMSEIERLAKEDGCEAVELTSADYRVGAHQFYETIGYTKKKTTVYIKDM